MPEVPAGYLGAQARIRSGPAPELVRAGYAVETADGPLLHHGLNLADLAHVLALGELVPDGDARALVGALLGLVETDPADFPFDPIYGDAINCREAWLTRRTGSAAGWLAAGRTRREAGRIAFRLALRARTLDLATAVARFAASLTALAERHAATLMADYTYLQAAQPTTFGHYLLCFAYPALRDGERVRAAHAWVDRSPGGVGGVAGTRLPLDREVLAGLLGFDGLVEHAREATWEADGLVELTTAAALAATNASRLAEDLEILASAEFGLVRIGDAFCRASVLMPHKRNPYALAVLRGGAGTLLGRVAGLLATQRTPSARTDNLLYAYAEVSGAVERGTALVDLAAAVVDGLEPDVARMAAGASDGFTQTTDLTELICVRTGLDYRSAYRVVGRAVATAVDQHPGPASIDDDALARAAREVGVAWPGLPAGLVDEALDPAAAVASRTAPGGAAPAPMATMLAACAGAARDLAEWAEGRRRASAAAERDLLTRARALSAGEGRGRALGSTELGRGLRDHP